MHGKPGLLPTPPWYPPLQQYYYRYPYLPYQPVRHQQQQQQQQRRLTGKKRPQRPSPAIQPAPLLPIDQAEQLLDQAMSAPAFLRGPLSLLRRIFTENLPIRVVIRRTGGIRGFCVAQKLRAFDKHMNLVLQDVSITHVVSEIVYRKELHLNAATRGKSRGNRKRAVFVQKEHTRQAKMLFVKGDSVVSITLGPTMPAPTAAIVPMPLIEPSNADTNDGEDSVMGDDNT